MSYQEKKVDNIQQKTSSFVAENVTNSKARFTQGPWKVAGHGDGNQQLPILANGKIIAAIRDNGSLADARLIAAAPDLLEACKRLLMYIGLNAPHLIWPNEEPLLAARAAIAKAEGKE